jgi:hypothetical protein
MLGMAASKQSGTTETDCMAGVIGLELANVGSS